jgi:hypothetical protein
VHPQHIITAKEALLEVENAVQVVAVDLKAGLMGKES